MSLPPMRPSGSTSSSTTRHPCGGPQCVSVRFANILIEQSLHHAPQSFYFHIECLSIDISLYIYICIYIYTYIIHCGLAQVSVHVSRTGQTSPVVSFGGRTTTSRSDEAMAAAICTPCMVYIFTHHQFVSGPCTYTYERERGMWSAGGWVELWRERGSDPQGIQSRCISARGIRCTRSRRVRRRPTRPRHHQRSGRRCR